MAGQFGTQTDVMRSAAQRVADTSDAIEAQQRSLEGQLAPLAGQWKGQASTAFGELMVRWNEDVRRINEALRAIGATVAQSGTQYQAVDQEQQQSMSSIRSALG